MEEKPVPAIVTEVPEDPLAGLKLVIVAGTMKPFPELPVNPLTVTLINPVEAPEGTIAISCVVVAEATVAIEALNLTVLLAIVELKLLPVIVTDVPAVPLEGVKLPTVGGEMTVKVPELTTLLPLT